MRELVAGTFDAHLERFLVRIPLWVNEQGWEELHDALNLSMEECLSVQQRTKQRMEESGAPAEGFPVRVHLVSFEPGPVD